MSADESIYRPGSMAYADFKFYDAESMRGHTSVFDFACLSTRHPFGFLRRSETIPLEIMRCSNNAFKNCNQSIHRVRVDKHGTLDNSYEFNILLFNN